MTTCAVPCKKKIKKNGQNIRNPQYWCCIFALWLMITARLLAAHQFHCHLKDNAYFGKKDALLRERSPFSSGKQKRALRVATKTQRWNISRRPRRWRSKESWLQFMNKPIPLSQLADSSPNQVSSSQKLPPPCKGEVTEGQRGKKARSDDSVYFVAKTFTTKL